MKTQTLDCDIIYRIHGGTVKTKKIDVIFDHDQEDGKSKMSPYLDNVEIEICQRCWDHMMESRTYIYAFGAMGHNTYEL